MSKNPNRKPRSDSRLKNLPDDRQLEIIKHLRDHKGEETVAWLRADGLETSEASLSEFRSWWVLQQQFNSVAEDTQTVVDLLKEERPELSEEAIQEYANKVFSLKALKTEDADTYINLMSARNKGLIESEKLKLKKREAERKEEELKLAQQKFAESLKTDVDKAMDAFAEQLKGNPKLVAAYQHFRGEVNAILQPKAKA